MWNYQFLIENCLSVFDDRELLPVDKNRARTQIFAMDQYSRLFHSCREPGLKKDTLHKYFKTGGLKVWFMIIETILGDVDGGG